MQEAECFGSTTPDLEGAPRSRAHVQRSTLPQCDGGALLPAGDADAGSSLSAAAPLSAGEN